jgi:hypothetical protein
MLLRLHTRNAQCTEPAPSRRRGRRSCQDDFRAPYERISISPRYALTLSDIANSGNWHFCQGIANFAKVSHWDHLASANLSLEPVYGDTRFAHLYLEYFQCVVDQVLRASLQQS